MGVTTWTAERDDAIRNYRTMGFSFSVIASEMGLSRNSVISRAGRIGVPMQIALSRTLPKPVPSNLQKRVRKPRQETPVMLLPPAVVEKPVVEFLPEDCPDTAIGFVDLTNTTCRWPYGDGPFRFCGACEADLAGGRPYCAKHAKQARRESVKLARSKVGKFGGSSAVFEIAC